MGVPTIMVVEYDWATRDLIEEIILDAGYVPHLWFEDNEAFEIIQAQQPDLVILDLWLKQRGDGFALLEQLWQDSSTRQIPVLVCTTDTRMLEEYDGVLQARGCDTLAKPFMVDDLLTRLAAHVGSQGNRAQHVIQWHEPKMGNEEAGIRVISNVSVRRSECGGTAQYRGDHHKLVW